MKYTGYKDINGTDIYVGDTVKCSNHPEYTPKIIEEYEPNKYILKDTYIILCGMEIKQFQIEVIK